LPSNDDFTFWCWKHRHHQRQLFIFTIGVCLDSQSVTIGLSRTDTTRFLNLVNFNFINISKVDFEYYEWLTDWLILASHSFFQRDLQNSVIIDFRVWSIVATNFENFSLMTVTNCFIFGWSFQTGTSIVEITLRYRCCPTIS
jgi:hypothetical protein